MDDPEVVAVLIQTEIIPLCLRIMENGSELSKTVATFILQKILLDDNGLSYICATAERFYAVSTVLSGMVTKLLETPSVRLLKHVVRCYLRLSDHLRAREALRQCLPEALKDQSFAPMLKTEEAVQRWLTLLAKNLSERGVSGLPGTTAFPDQSQLPGGGQPSGASFGISSQFQTGSGGIGGGIVPGLSGLGIGSLNGMDTKGVSVNGSSTTGALY